MGSLHDLGAVPARSIQSAERRCAVCGERFPAEYAVCPKDGTPLGDRPTDADPLLGEMLAGTYRITRLLARGGMGRLYEAEHARLPRRVAVKVIHDGFARSADAVARFEREARAAASVQSDHVLEVFDVVRSPDDRPCIVAERLDGEDLQARLDRVGPLRPAEALAIARELCQGLSAAHACGVVHRDLKPSNVFLAASADGRVTVKILDFGVAKLASSDEDITKTGAVLGTPAYMAPEQARGAAAVDARADVYGVGAVAYKMLTGHAPHEAADATASLARLLHERPMSIRKLRPEVPASVAEVVERAMARDPRDRYTDVRTLARALGAVTPDEPVTLRPPEDEAPLVPKDSEHTVVLPRGSVEHRSARARGDRRSFPRALAAVGAATVAAGALATGAAGALGRVLGLDAATLGPAAALAGACVVVGLGIRLGRATLPHRHDAPHLDRLGSRLLRALLAGAATLGALELGRAALSALDAAGAPPSAVLVAALLGLAAAASGVAFTVAPRP